ncbi:MAG: lysostaphin resistance A-like protein [Salinirussus sp.]
MDSDRGTDGGVEPTPAGSDDPPLYKFGDSGPRIRSILHTLIIVVAAFVVANVLLLVVVQVFAAAGLVPPDFESIADLAAPVAAVVFGANFVGFILVGLGYLRYRGGFSPFRTDLFDVSVPDLRDLGLTVAGLVGLFALLSVVSIVISSLGLESASNVTIDLGRENPTLFLYFIGIAFLLNAPAEEFLFRGIVQGLFRDAYGVVPAVLLASATFGVVHFLALSGSSSGIAVTLAVTAMLGVVLGTLYELTRNLVVPTLVHGAFNAIQFLVLYLQATGAVPTA